MANQPSSPLKKLEEQITCPICKEHFANPKVLPCFHSFCLHCLQGVPIVFVEGNHSLHCPTCQSSCLVPDNRLASLPPSLVINNLIEEYELKKKVSAHQHASCDNCDNTSVDCYCKKCAKFFCPECLLHHNKWKPNASHQILSIDEIVATAFPHAKHEICTDHNKFLDLFCESCQQLICLDCMEKKHKDHNYNLVREIYHQHKCIIFQSSLEPLNMEYHRLAAAKQTLDKRRNEIFWNDAEIKEEIHRTITQSKIHLDEIEEKLIEDVDSASSHKVNMIDQQMKELDIASTKLADFMNYIEQFMYACTPQQILLTKPQVISHAQNVITRVKDKTFQPLEQPDIELVMSDTIHLVHNIGKVKYTVFSPPKVKLSFCHIPLIHKHSTINIGFPLHDGSLASVPLSFISCHLTPPDNLPPIQCSVKESSQQSGQYDVVFTSFTRGLHQLHVTINDRIIPGSPIDVPVSVPPWTRGTPVKTITGLNTPSGIAVTDDGLVVVSECNAHCITLLDKKGEKIRSFGSRGKRRGQLLYPRGVAVTSNRTILVSDGENKKYRIQEFTMEGDCISCVGTSFGFGPLQLSSPRGIVVNKTTGKVLVADRDNARVQVLHSDLTFSHTFGSEGSGQGQFKMPQDLTIDSQGFIYVTDWGNHHVQKFTPEGRFVSSFGSSGYEPGQLHCPSGIAVDDQDLLYVNSKNGFVSIYTTNGQYVNRIQTTISSKFEDYTLLLNGVAFDNNGNLYVCSICSKKLLVY